MRLIVDMVVMRGPYRLQFRGINGWLSIVCQTLENRYLPKQSVERRQHYRCDDGIVRNRRSVKHANDAEENEM